MLAAQYLEAAGWTVVDRNYRFGRHEIDLIIRRGRIVAFVEVKARASRRFGDPLAAITAAKRRDIVRVARVWIARHGGPDDLYRFDAVSIVWSGGMPQVEHIQDAWRLMA